MEKKRFERTEILDEDFLEKLDEEIHKKYPYNAKNISNTNNIEILEDTAEIYLNSFFEDIDSLKKEFEEDIPILEVDDDIEILEEEIDDFYTPSKDLENTIELLDVELRDEPLIVRKKTTPKKKPWIILLSICLIIIVFSVYKLFFWKHDSIKTNEKIKDIIKETNISEILINSDIASGSIANEDYFNYLDVDFSLLLKQNTDVKGWIKVNNTNINYPFVQTSDNDFYLKHSFDKSYNSAGWVFADFRNNFSYLDQNTILYAHGRLDNTMFGSLKRVVDKDWYTNKDNYLVQLSTLDSKMIFEVFSVYTIEPEVYYITPSFTNDSDYNQFLTTLTKRSVYDFNVEVGIDDKILTLSSCYNDNLRVVLHAKLVNIVQS